MLADYENFFTALKFFSVRYLSFPMSLNLDLFFHAIAFSFDNDCVGMMQKPVQDSGSKCCIIVKNLRPVFVCPIWGNDDSPFFIATADDLKKQVRSMLVNWQVAKFIEDEQWRFEIPLQAVFQLPRSLSGRQGIDHINSSGKQYGISPEAGFISKCCRQMSFAIMESFCLCKVSSAILYCFLHLNVVTFHNISHQNHY